MDNIIKYGEFKPNGKQRKKKQIILTHTSRGINDYLVGLKYRHNGEYDRIPNYVISREGKILKLLSNVEYSNFFNDKNVNRNSIIISLENLGWLHKEPLKGYYVNWIGDIYNGVVCEKKWRDYYFWQPYLESQINATVDLCKHLFNEMSIKSNVVGHNTKINGIEKYEGLVTRSNYDVDYTDVSPAFNFDEFLKKIENE